MTIWKFPLNITDVQQITVPGGSEFLSVQVQRGIPCIWALVDSTQPKRQVEIRIYGTGHPIDQIGQFIGTFQVQGGALVFHVFAV